MPLLIPGPTPVPDAVRDALAQPAVPHREAGFERLLRSCCDDLRAIFRTEGLAFPVTGSGTTAMECAMWSLLDPERPGVVVACHCGKFGRRWLEAGERMRAAAPTLGVVGVEAPWGEPIVPHALSSVLREHPDAAMVTIVHSETSTATRSDLEALVRIARELAPAALIVADCITSAGALPLHQDDWGVDACVGASQKAFMLPPGLGFVSLGERAVRRLESSRPMAPLTMDLRAWLACAKTGRAPFTPATSSIRALRVALDMMLEEGLEAIWRRTRRLAEATREAIAGAGLELASSCPSDALTGVRLPEGVGDEVRQTLRQRHDVHLAGGQGPWKGRVVRISHMGAVTEGDTIMGVEALCRTIEESRQDAPGGAGVNADAGARLIRQRLAGARVV